MSGQFHGLSAVHQAKTPLLFTAYEAGWTQSRSRYCGEEKMFVG